MQEVWPELEPYLPVGHKVQLGEPAVLVKLPAGHGVLLLESLVENVPGGLIEQVLFPTKL
jgi:hypothetical protein